MTPLLYHKNKNLSYGHTFFFLLTILPKTGRSATRSQAAFSLEITPTVKVGLSPRWRWPLESVIFENILIIQLKLIDTFQHTQAI